MIGNSNVPDNDNVRKIIEIEIDLTEDFTNNAVYCVLTNIQKNVNGGNEGDLEKPIPIKNTIEGDNLPGIEEVSNDFLVGTEKIQVGN